MRDHSRSYLRIHGSGRLGTLLMLTTLLNGPASATADELFVSPDGQSGAVGTLHDPLDLDTALNDATRVHPGDTVWLMGGTYGGPFTKQSVPSGTSTDPIIYRAVPGARVTLTAAYDDPYALALSNAEHVWIWGVEATMGGAEELGYIPSAAVYILGGRESKIINCVVHDTPNRSGIGSFASLGGEYYGNIVYRNGLYANQLGHGIYSQNRPDIAGGDLSALPWMEHRENVVFDNFGTGQHSYGSAPQLAKMRYEGTVSYGNGLPEGSTLPVLNYIVGGLQYDDLFELRECFSWFPAAGSFKRGADLGYLSGANGRVTVENCVWIGGLEALWLRGWEQMTFRNNRLYTPSGSGIVLVRPPGFNPDQSDVDHNTYYDLPGTTTFCVDGTCYDDLSSWTTATGGFDPNGTVLPGPPANRWVFLRPNAYESDRAHLIVYNWPGTSTVPIDLGELWDLAPGDKYRVLSVQDVWGAPVVQGAYSGGPVAMPMIGNYAPQFATYLVFARKLAGQENPVPVMSGWGMISMAILICAACGWIVTHRRREERGVTARDKGVHHGTRRLR